MKNKMKMYLASAVLTEERLPSFTLFREMQVTSFTSFQSPYHFFLVSIQHVSSYIRLFLYL